MLEEFSDFCKNFASLTLFFLIFFSFLICNQVGLTALSKQVSTRKFSFLNKRPGHLIVYFW